jgi:hypothetical protein
VNRYVIIPCGGAKLDTAAPARDIYTGSMFRDALGTALELVDAEHVLILSALHGLVTLDTVIEPYDLKMGRNGSISQASLHTQMNNISQGEPMHITSLLPQAYLNALSNASLGLDVNISDIYSGCRGIGDQKARLSQLRKKVAA